MSLRVQDGAARACLGAWRAVLRCPCGRASQSWGRPFPGLGNGGTGGRRGLAVWGEAGGMGCDPPADTHPPGGRTDDISPRHWAQRLSQESPWPEPPSIHPAPYTLRGLRGRAHQLTRVVTPTLLPRGGAPGPRKGNGWASAQMGVLGCRCPSLGPFHWYLNGGPWGGRVGRPFLGAPGLGQWRPRPAPRVPACGSWPGSDCHRGHH